MKTKFLPVIISLFIFASAIVLNAQTQPKEIKAYLTVSIQGKALKNKETGNPGFADKIKNVLTSEGIQILSDDDIGRPGESNLNIYVTLKDSLKITAKRFYDGGKNMLMQSRYPEKVYAYSSSSDVTGSVRKYVKEYIKGFSKLDKKTNK